MSIVKLCIATIATLISMNIGQAQVIIKGPTECAPGTMQTISLEQAEGKDLKVEAFQAGESTKANWNIFKNLEGKYVILVLPQPGDTIYTFVAAINNAEKTFISTFTLRVKPTVPVKPIEPTPTPTPAPQDEFQTKLKAAYQSSPDPAALNRLIAAFDQVTKLSFDNQGQMETVLTATTTKSMKPTDFPAVQKVLQDYLLDKQSDARKPAEPKHLQYILDNLKRL